MGDLDPANISTITVVIDPVNTAFEPNARMTQWRDGREQIAKAEFTVQAGTQAMRDAVTQHKWVFRVAIEVVENLRGCMVTFQALPMELAEVNRLVDQTSPQLAITEIAQNYTRWNMPAEGFDYPGPAPLYMDGRNDLAKDNDFMPSSWAIKQYIRAACMHATSSPRLTWPPRRAASRRQELHNTSTGRPSQWNLHLSSPTSRQWLLSAPTVQWPPPRLGSTPRPLKLHPDKLPLLQPLRANPHLHDCHKDSRDKAYSSRIKTMA